MPDELDDLRAAVGGALADRLDRLGVGSSSGSGMPRHRREARQRHHRVAVAAEHEGVDVLAPTRSGAVAMNVRMRAESSTPAMPMTRSRGKPLTR